MKTSVASLTYSKLYARVQKEIENTVVQANYDAIVLGVGSMGSSTCYALAKKGYKVLGLDQFDIPHEQGSHSGQSRIIRKAYGEASDYVPLLEKAYQNWKTLESETGYQVYHKTGLVYFGTKNNRFLETVKESSSQFNIRVNKLSEIECQEKYPQFVLAKNFERLEEPDAGLLLPELCILLMVQQAMQHGAIIQTKEKTLAWKREKDTIIVTTNKGNYQTKKLIITAGAWVGKVFPSLSQYVKISRKALVWVQPKKWEKFVLHKFPCWLLRNNGYDFYGFPILPKGKFEGPLGMKLALHHPGGAITDPDMVDRNKKESDEKILINFLDQFIPDGYEKTLEMKTCLYTNTPDENFIVDFLPGYDKDVTIAAGFSGHGFKFASVIGEIMAELTINGATKIPIHFLNAQRFDM